MPPWKKRAGPPPNGGGPVWLNGRGYWRRAGQADPKQHALLPVFRPTGASVGLYGGTDNGQPQAGCALGPAAGLVPPIKGFPQAGQILGRNKRAVVIHLQAGGRPPRPTALPRMRPPGAQWRRALESRLSAASSRDGRFPSSQISSSSSSGATPFCSRRRERGARERRTRADSSSRSFSRGRPDSRRESSSRRFTQRRHPVALLQHHRQVGAALFRVDVLRQGLRVGAQHAQGGLQLVGRPPAEVPLPLQLLLQLALGTPEGVGESVEL